MLPITGSESNACGDKTGKTKALSLAPSAPGQENFSNSFQMNAGYSPDGELKFRVYGRLEVSHSN